MAVWKNGVFCSKEIKRVFYDLRIPKWWFEMKILQIRSNFFLTFPEQLTLYLDHCALCVFWKQRHSSEVKDSRIKMFFAGFFERYIPFEKVIPMDWTADFPAMSTAHRYNGLLCSLKEVLWLNFDNDHLYSTIFFRSSKVLSHFLLGPCLIKIVKLIFSHLFRTGK